jgi:pilus assembly protein Flp/PilA
MLEHLGLRIAMALTGAEGVRDRLRRDEGQTLVEYALILVTIAIAVTAAMVFLQEEISALFSEIGSEL